MKYVKILGLAAVAAMALMAFVGAGSASATTLSSTNGNLPKGTVIHATLTKGSTAILESGSTVLDTCTESTIKGTTSNETGPSVEGPIEVLSWGGCTHTTDTVAGGNLAITWTSGTNGTLAGKGSKVTVSTIFGSCTYGTSETGTTLGEVKGGNPATIAISTTVPLIEGGFSCPSTSTWTANYTVTSATYNGTAYTTLDVTN